MSGDFAVDEQLFQARAVRSAEDRVSGTARTNGNRMILNHIIFYCKLKRDFFGFFKKIGDGAKNFDSLRVEPRFAGKVQAHRRSAITLPRMR